MASGILNIDPEGNLSRYLQEISKFPLLAPDEELTLARRWRDGQNIDAMNWLVTSHLRLVAKTAMGFRGYGLPVSELISEGNVGLIQATKRFDADRGARLAPCAMCWIRTAIQEYVLRCWPLVKMGTTRVQKRLFFNLRRLKEQMRAIPEDDLRPEQATEIARTLGVPEQDVISMDRRLAAPDLSLHAPMRADGEGEWQDWLANERTTQEEALAEREELTSRQALLLDALNTLNGRERHILIECRLWDDPVTFQELSLQFGISCERVRMIEIRAFAKLQKVMRKNSLTGQRGAAATAPSVGAVRNRLGATQETVS
jgi:RNA polymerase sigma-32 factor